ncbi:hypothetical protein VTO42DRAFT_1147 [Malbranchea cinnamomea]
MVMAEPIDVDDLFGDPTSLELSLASTVPTVRHLPQRFDELRLSGCCRKIAWSRTGTIAYISEDGQKVFLRLLVYKTDHAKWSLDDDNPGNLITEAHDDHTFTHLCWNELGTELAIVDSCGRISTFAMSIALNALSSQKPATIDPCDDGNYPVGLMWLSINRPIFTLDKASRANGRWSYSRLPRRPLGPVHPTNKGALFCVTRSGYIRLIFHRPDSKWSEVTAELKHTPYSNGTLTHAALVPVEGSGILIATYSTCGRLCLYRATVKWDPPQGGVFRPPSIQIVHIQSESPKVSFHWPGVSSGHPESIQSVQTSLFSLTHLEIITGFPDTPGGTFPPNVMAVFSSPPVPPGAQSQEGPASVIVRWEISTMTLTLHSSFDDVISKKSVAQLKPKTELQIQKDLHFNRFIVSIDYMETGCVIAVTFDDGEISFFDAKSMTPLNTNDLDTVTSMPQAGFSFPADTSGLHISFSPSGCVAAVLDGDGQINLRFMEHSFGAGDGLYIDGKFSCALAALALAFGRACGNDATFEDILLIAKRQLNSDTLKALVAEAYASLGINLDFTAEQDKLMNNPFIQKCLSLQGALGSDSSSPHRRSLSSAVPWYTLQLRQLSVLLAYCCHFTKSGGLECYEPEILKLVTGNIKWALDFINYLVDELFDVADNIVNQGSEVGNSIPAKAIGNPTIVLLLASTPRSFLRYICRGLRGLVSSYKSATNLTPESYHLCTKIVSMVEESAIKVDVYEKCLAGIDSAVKHAYQDAGFSPADKAISERELLTIGTIPPVLQPAVCNILANTVPMIRPEIDRMRLYLNDYSWLGICDDRMTAKFTQTYDVDVLKRSIVKRDGLRAKRKCVRCCSISEDLSPPRSFASFRMLAKTGMLRTCTCGGNWVIEKHEVQA